MNDKTRIVCDLRSAPDTPAQRAGEYRRLFETSLSGRDRTDRMIRFRFRKAAVDEDQLRSLAARERACCPFFDIRLTTVGDQVWWETRVEDTPDAKIMLDEFYRLPEQLTGIAAAVDGLTERGLLLAPETNRP